MLLPEKNTNLISFFSRFIFLRKNVPIIILFHTGGLSALGSSLFLQSFVLDGTLENGYFRGIEQNLFVLFSEVLLTVFAISYCGYLLWRFVLSKLTYYKKLFCWSLRKK